MNTILELPECSKCYKQAFIINGDYCDDCVLEMRSKFCKVCKYKPVDYYGYCGRCQMRKINNCAKNADICKSCAAAKEPMVIFSECKFPNLMVCNVCSFMLLDGEVLPNYEEFCSACRCRNCPLERTSDSEFCADCITFTNPEPDPALVAKIDAKYCKLSEKLTHGEYDRIEEKLDSLNPQSKLRGVQLIRTICNHYVHYLRTGEMPFVNCKECGERDKIGAFVDDICIDCLCK